jgi:hypothetical protein
MSAVTGLIVGSMFLVSVLMFVGKIALRSAIELGLGVFRPWRGDPWPRGVQEDDDARFSWVARPRYDPTAPEPPVGRPAPRVATPDRPAGVPMEIRTGAPAEIEDLPVGSTSTTRVARIEIHHPGA